MPSSPLVIRQAIASDLPELGLLGGHLMRVHHAFDRQRFLPPGDNPESGYSWFLGTQLHEGDVVIFVAEANAALVGYVFAGLEDLSWKELRGPAGFIHDIVVNEETRRLGVARQLMEAAIEWLRSRGAPRVMLWTATQNQPAQRLFEALGFRRTMVEMTLELRE